MGAGRSTALLAMVSRALLQSWRFAPATARPLGTPPPAVSTLRVVPLLPRSVGGVPTFFPPTGGLGPGPVQREPLPGKALQGLRGHEALCPYGDADVGRRPLLAAAVGGTVRAEPGGIAGAPLATGTEHKEDGIPRVAIINAGAMTAQRMRLARRESWHHPCPYLVWHTPVTGGLLVVIRPRCGSCKRGFSSQDTLLTP